MGLIFLQLVPKKFANHIGQMFSIFGGITSLFLFFIFYKYSINGEIYSLPASAFFFLLSVRFGFWFYSRVLRAANSAGFKKRIAWVEFGYYGGIILGLIIWQILNFEIALSSILIIDAFMQFIAGFF